MEVLQKGISKETWRLKATCPHCSAKLAISYKDLDFLVDHNFFGTPKLFYSTHCSECRGGIKFPEKEIPMIIQRAVYNEMNLLERAFRFGL